MDKINLDNYILNLNEALSSLYTRRQPITDIPIYEKLGSEYDPIFRSITASTENSGKKYILGAMQPIPQWSTCFLYRLGSDFSTNIITNLNEPWIFKFQGSVPLNIHIKSGSDLDILFIHSKNLYVPEKINSNVYDELNISIADQILYIKNRCHDIFTKLSFTFQRNDKSIKLQNCLPVKTDIVPACWYDTLSYQLSKKDEERGVIILEEKAREIVKNYPFKHIDLVNKRNVFYADRLGKCIRLLKNIKADLSNPDLITLSSFDITSLIYHMPCYSNINTSDSLELAKKLHNYIQQILKNSLLLHTLAVPDESRIIFNHPHKITSLLTLGNNLDKILREANAL